VIDLGLREMPNGLMSFRLAPNLVTDDKAVVRGPAERAI
jgi:hypothetical protein